MKNILIVGVKGFIGSHLKSFFEDLGYTVYGADVVTDYAAQNYFLIDVANSNFNAVFQQQRFDLCVNCSGAANVPDSLKNPNRDFHLNTVNVFRLLSAIRDFNADCRFLNLSSAAVYGNPKILPVTEETEAQPVSPYGYHKYLSEMICTEFYQLFGVSTCSLRIFSAFGEGLKKQLFWDLYLKSQNKDKIQLFGTGDETRDFIYIKDLVRLISLVAEKSQFKSETINAANGIEISIQEAVSLFYSNYDNIPLYSFSAGIRKGDPSRWVADITKIKELGYKPEHTLSQGLQNYYQWLQKKENQ